MVRDHKGPNINMDQETGYAGVVEWIQLAQDMDEWWAL
jgi:hypothetical protein